MKESLLMDASVKKSLLNRLQHITEQNILDIENHKAKGNPAIGFYCLYGPNELAVAAGAIPLPLCGTRQEPIEAAEKDLPRNLCPLIKSSYGFAITDTCPFFRFSDMIVADTTCDGKKKMFELMADIKPIHVLQLPHQQDFERFLVPWEREIDILRSKIEEFTGRKITDQKIQDAVRLLNRERKAKKRLMDVTRAKPSPLTGMELLEILFKIGFLADKEKGIRLINEIADVCETLSANSQSPYTLNTPRILLTGVPVGLGSEKVVTILEESGASVVALESCSGYKQTFLVDENKPVLTALAEQYLSIPCSVMSPNPGRLEVLEQMIHDFSIDGVVDLTWQACHTYNVESSLVQKLVNKDLELPYLHIETDYSQSDMEQIRVRAQAFLEMI